MKRVWFVSHYSMPPKYEMRVKTQRYAHYLKERGYEIRIFSASTIHNSDINLITTNDEYIEAQYDDLDFVHIKCHDYSGNGIKRILNMQEFARKFSKIAEKFPKPDVIVADVNCINYKHVYTYCKKHNISIYIDMRDLWPMCIVEYYKYSEHNPIIQFLYRREKVMYQRVNGVLFAMEGWKDYLEDRGWTNVLDITKFHYINNGVDYDSFQKEIEINPYVDKELDDNNLLKVVYAGSIREANHLEPVVRAAQYAKNVNGKKIQIILFGDGDDCARLKALAKELNIDNVSFKGFVEKKYMPNILSKADICILNYKKAKTLKYGGSQNKLFEYLAVGKPVLMTVDMNYNIVTINNCGIALKDPKPKDIAKGVKKLAELDANERRELSTRATQLAKEYDYKILSQRLLSIITEGENRND